MSLVIIIPGLDLAGRACDKPSRYIHVNEEEAEGGLRAVVVATAWADLFDDFTQPLGSGLASCC